MKMMLFSLHVPSLLVLAYDPSHSKKYGHGSLEPLSFLGILALSIFLIFLCSTFGSVGIS